MDSDDEDTLSSIEGDDGDEDQRRFESLQRHYKGRVLKEIKTAFSFQGDFHGKRARRTLQKIEKVLNIQNGDWKNWWMRHRQKIKSKERRIPIQDLLQSNEQLREAMEEYTAILDSYALYKYPPQPYYLK